MDWLGAIIGVSGLICVQVALVSAPASGWSTQYIFMLLILGVLLIAFFVIAEIKIAEQPLVPFKMLKADVSFVLGAVACGWASFGIWTWFLWKFLLGTKGDTPVGAAVQVLPIVPVALVASVLTAWMMRTTAPAWTLFWALVAFTFGPLLLAVDSKVNETPYWSWTFISLLVMPFGMDMSFPAATLIMSNFFPPQQQGLAGSLISTVVNYSISLGLGLASTVEVYTNDHGQNVLAGIRGGWFMGVGLGGLGCVICVAFVVRTTILGKGVGTGTGTGGAPPHDDPRQPQLQARPTTKSRRSTFSSTKTLTPSQEKFFRPSKKVPDRERDQRLHEVFNHVNDTAVAVPRPSTAQGIEGLAEMEPAYRSRGSWESVDMDEQSGFSQHPILPRPFPSTSQKEWIL